VVHLRFEIDVQNPALRQIGVSLEADVQAWPAVESTPPSPDRIGLVLFLPTWTPGSYLVREYSRHLSHPVVEDADTGEILACEKVTKNRFRIDARATTRTMRIRYRVYAHELTVRTADLTADHAYWNHACVLLWPVDALEQKATVVVRMPVSWSLVSALEQHPPGQAESRGAQGARATRLNAQSFDELVDSPCLAGALEVHSFEVAGVRHTIALDGLGSVRPPDGLVEDFTAVVRAAAAVFGGCLPYPNYLFQCLFAADGHGGLEHANCTTLLASRTALRSEKGYREFLALAAHELFHAWNVKRLRPVEFWRYDYEHENYTRFLWLIEGWTAYYDDLLCVRAGLTSVPDYLATVATSVNAMLTGPGRLQLSLADSSFDAWIRLYRPDENTRNSSQNYYGNGAIAALCLDLALRHATGGRNSLDDVLRSLLANTFEQGRGYTTADVHGALATIGGDELVTQLRTWIEGPLEPRLAESLAVVGVRMTMRDTERPSLGVTFESGSTVIATVAYGSAAEVGGLQPGDEILAIENLRVDASRWPDVVASVTAIDQQASVLHARRGYIRTALVTPRSGIGTVAFELDEAAGEAQVALRESWLRGARKVGLPLLTARPAKPRG
jgi:predicted metalloprotease with PDZ domain